MKSEPIPKKNDDPVKFVVEDTLQEMVIDYDKNGIDLLVHMLFIDAQWVSLR
jgi:hypothetical protein